MNKEMVPMLTVREAACLLHVSSNTLRRWSDRGIVQVYRISQRGDRRFRRDEIARVLSQLKANRGDPQKVEMVQR